MNSCLIVGAGSWGTALALSLGRKGIPVALHGRDKAAIERLRERRENERYLPGHLLPESVVPFSDLQAAEEGRDLAVLAVPSSGVREALQQAKAVAKLAEMPWLMAAKGLEPESGMRMTEIGFEVLGSNAKMAALSGPNLAKEMALEFPTATVIASQDETLAEEIQALFLSPALRVYTSSDVVGVELGGALKNVLAIAGGVSDGLGFGDNTKAALMTRGLGEMTRLGVALGATVKTFLGLAGIGDLFATAVSRYSRNYRIGFALGEGIPLETAIRDVAQVAEGVPTSQAVLELARCHGVEMPLFEAIARVIGGDLAPAGAVRELMQRTPRQE